MNASNQFTASTALSYNNSDATHALAYGRTQDRPLLETVLALFAALVTAGADFGAMWSIQLDAYKDPITGQGLTVPLFMVGAVSTLTLFAYVAVGYLWHRKRRFFAVALYAMLLAFIFVSGFSSWSGPAEEALSAITPATGDAWNQGGGNTSTIGVFIFVLIRSGLYTIPGLMFVVAKQWLERLLKKCQAHNEIARLRAQKDRLDKLSEERAKAEQSLQLLESSGDDFEMVLAAAVSAEAQALNVRLNGEEQIVRSFLSSSRQKEQAQQVIERLRLCQSSLSVLGIMLTVTVLGLLCAMPTAAQAGSEIDDAPSFVLLLDNSPSPTSNESFMEAAWPTIENGLKALPVGSTVTLSSVGNATLSPFVWHSRIQAGLTRDGMPRQMLIDHVRAMVLQFPQKVAETGAAGQSELIGGMESAAALLNVQSTGNRIVMLSDGIENSRYGRLQQTDNYNLPSPKFRFPPGTKVTIIGIGQGITSDRAHVLTESWRSFLTRAGASSPVLQRE